MRGVEQQVQPVRAGDALERLDVAAAAPEVDAEDPGRARRDQPLDARRIDGVRRGSMSREHRRDLAATAARAAVATNVNDGTITSPRQVEGTDRDLERHRAVARRDAVADADGLGDTRARTPARRGPRW